MAAAHAAANAESHVMELPPVIPGLHVHIDGDYLAYYAAGNDETTPGEARHNAIDIIINLRNKSGAERVTVHNTGNGSTKGERFLIATVKQYQAQRLNTRKPKNHPYLQNWLHTYDGELFKPHIWKDREADDGIAYMAQWHVSNDPLGYCVIATADKDMQMLPGLHIRWKEHNLVRVNPGDYEVLHTYRHLKDGQPVDDIKVYGTKWFWLQMLQGDAADNIPGLEMYVDHRGAQKKLGEKTALKLLEGTINDDDAFTVVSDLYEGFYGNDWQNRFVEQAGLLWLRRGRDALITDFTEYLKVSFPIDVIDATQALIDRVQRDRLTLNQIAS